MANKEHIKILNSGRETWNQWMDSKYSSPLTIIAKDSVEANYLKIEKAADLSNADLSKRDLSGYSFYRTNFSSSCLRNANLSNCFMRRCNLENTDLSSVDFSNTNLSRASMIGAVLDKAKCVNTIFDEANLSKTSLYKTAFNNASLVGARLLHSKLIETRLINCDISASKIYGISSWDIELENTTQSNLSITKDGEDFITVDNLFVAQFLHLLIYNSNIREVIDTITSKVVLILGRFTTQRKVILDSLRDELRKKNYLPILFDFDIPKSRDLTETISTLAHLSRFIIADISDAKSIPQELQSIVPNLPSVPILPILHKDEKEYGMFEHFRKYPWVSNVLSYDERNKLSSSFINDIIKKCESKVIEQLTSRSRPTAEMV